MSTFLNLPRKFYERDTVEVAEKLLGHYLLRKVRQGNLLAKIVEVEAYLDENDPASHAAAGKSPRAKIFWGPPGRAYVFVIYGLYHCLNVITRPEGEAGCVLIRAVQPLKGHKIMRQNRAKVNDIQLTTGPGKLCQALAIDLGQNGIDLTQPQSELQIIEGDTDNFKIQTTARIGINKARDKNLRFVIANHPYLSRK